MNLIPRILLFLMVVILLAGFIDLASSQLSSPTAYWKFNQTGFPIIANDTMGIMNLTLNNTVLRMQTGKLGNAIRINNSGVSVAINLTTTPNSLKLDENPFTIAFWINGSNGDGGGGFNIFSAGAGANTAQRWGIGTTSGINNLSFVTNNIAVLYSPNMTLNGSYNRVIFVREGTGANQFKVYVNNRNYVNTTLANNFSDVSTGFKIDTSNSGSSGYNLDDFRIYNNYALTVAEINTDYNNGAGQEASGVGTSSSTLTVTLTSPSNSSVFSTSNITFNSSATIISGNFTNSTIWIWNVTGGIVNKTTNVVMGNVSNYTSWNINGLTNGHYSWNARWCAVNNTGTICNFATNNFTFEIGASINNQTFNTNTYETLNETFQISINLLSGIELSLAQLVYNGTNYTVSNITSINTVNETIRILTRTIDIPLNENPFANETNPFFWRFTFSNAQQTVQETTPETQNVGFINYQICNTTYTIQALNFTLYDEFNQTNIVLAGNQTSTFESNWYYYVGSGTAYKNYSYQLLNNASKTSYQFCIMPYSPSNQTFKVSGDIDYFATLFRENQYHLRNAALTNVSNNILLYLLNEDIATKFFLTFTRGTQAITDATITVQKFFTGLGQFITTSILLTDDNGEAVMWQDLDKNYKYLIVQNGTLLGVVERASICSVAPCTLFISIDTTSADPFSSFYQYYAQNIVSSLTYNKTTKIVTYEFIDTTGLANYFRLYVRESRNNQTGATLCDTQLFSPSGTITCNVSSYSGEFVATGYISRSPELVDKIINGITDDSFIDDLGLTGVFLTLVFVIVIVFAGVIVTKGSPSGTLAFLGIGILIMKLIGFFPFTWVTVVALEFLIWFMVWKVKQ